MRIVRFSISIPWAFILRGSSWVSSSSLILVTSVTITSPLLSLSLSRFLLLDILELRCEISILVSSRFHQSISPVQILPHPLSVHLFAFPQSTLISLEERASSRVWCFIKWLSSGRFLKHQFEADKCFNDIGLLHVKYSAFIEFRRKNTLEELYKCFNYTLLILLSMKRSFWSREVHCCK